MSEETYIPQEGDIREITVNIGKTVVEFDEKRGCVFGSGHTLMMDERIYRSGYVVHSRSVVFETNISTYEDAILTLIDRLQKLNVK